MNGLDETQLEYEMIDIIKMVCTSQGIEEVVDAGFQPGKFIMSHVLVSIIPLIEQRTGFTIPVECYIFHDNNKNKGQLTIKETVNKLLKVAKA